MCVALPCLYIPSHIARTSRLRRMATADGEANARATMQGHSEEQLRGKKDASSIELWSPMEGGPHLV